MALDVDWAGSDPTNPYRIFVPRADMAIVQASPEVRELNVDAFRRDLRTLEAGVEGGPWPDTHNHKTESVLSGTTFARIVEILDPYLVEFEDGQYSVRAVGANHNLLDVKVNNQVSLAVFLSSGLINSPDIQVSSFGGKVIVDTGNTTGLATSGVEYPIGTQRRPSDNFADALAIAATYGLGRLDVLGQGVLVNGGLDYRGIRIVGQSPSLTSIVVDTAALVTGALFVNLTLGGVFDGVMRAQGCIVHDVDMVEGDFLYCGLEGVITLSGGSRFTMIGCYDNIAGAGTPVIDFGGVGQPAILRNYQGAIAMRNKSGSDEVSVDITPGRLILESTITGGHFIVKGTGIPPDDQSTGTTTVDLDGLISVKSVNAGSTMQAILGNVV